MQKICYKGKKKRIQDDFDGKRGHEEEFKIIRPELSSAVKEEYTEGEERAALRQSEEGKGALEEQKVNRSLTPEVDTPLK